MCSITTICVIYDTDSDNLYKYYPCKLSLECFPTFEIFFGSKFNDPD